MSPLPFGPATKREKEKEEGEKAKKDFEHSGAKAVNPWAVCHTTVDKDSNPEKYERCVKDIKKKSPIKHD